MILPERVLGRPGENWIWSGVAIGPIFVADMGDEFLAQRIRALHAVHQRDVAIDALSLDVVRVADDGRLRHLVVGDERRFHLPPCPSVARHVDDVVHPAGDPVIAVGIAAGSRRR